jgi:uncharacterized integral membrane protein
MPYIKTLLIIVVMAFLVVGGVANTQVYTLTFLDWVLNRALPLWLLILVAFLAGMVPIFIVGLPEKLAAFNRLRAVRARQRELEKQLRGLETEKNALQP